MGRLAQWEELLSLKGLLLCSYGKESHGVVSCGEKGGRGRRGEKSEDAQEDFGLMFGRRNFSLHLEDTGVLHKQNKKIQWWHL